MMKKSAVSVAWQLEKKPTDKKTKGKFGFFESKQMEVDGKSVDKYTKNCGKRRTD